jgi:hypothetical protein
MSITITLTPRVVLQNRTNGSYGIGEIIDLSCVLTGPDTNIGDVGYRITQGSGTIAGANVAARTATFTASGKAETVKIAAYAAANPSKDLAVAGLVIVAPTGLKFVKTSNVRHTHGQADAGFMGDVFLQPPGVSYERLQTREGAFKGKGTGYYASINNVNHQGNVNGFPVGGNRAAVDEVYSGIQQQPWSAGRFDWNIPWDYQLAGTTTWTTFAYANHVQEITALGAVSIGKYNAGPFTAKPSDANQNY